MICIVSITLNSTFSALRVNVMTETTSGCPLHNTDRRKSAKIAALNTKPNAGAHWVKKPSIARKILRSQNALQAGAGAEFVTFENPEHAPVFFLDGIDHHRKRLKIQKFLSAKAINERHHEVMRRVSSKLVDRLKSQGTAKLEDLSFDLAIEVVSEILGLTNSDPLGRASRIQRVLYSTLDMGKTGFAGLVTKFKQVLFTSIFFLRDVKPAIEARKKSPKNDAISFFLEDGYSSKTIIIECLTYGTAGMLTTREFIVMAAWYLFEDSALRQRFLDGDENEQLAILLEIVRLEPVAALIHRTVNEEVEGFGDSVRPAGELYAIDIRAGNIDEEMVGECPFAVDPERAKRQRDNGRFLTFSDGAHNCPGWHVAMHETRIFLEQLFRVPGLKLEREPDISWNAGLQGYELRNAIISCDKAIS